MRVTVFEIVVHCFPRRRREREREKGVMAWRHFLLDLFSRRGNVMVGIEEKLRIEIVEQNNQVN